MNKEVSNKIKIYNYLFTITMVVYHFRMIYPFNINYANNFDKIIVNLFLRVSDKIGYISMTFFFLLSGFLYYFNIDKSSEAITKMKKRIKTLLIPYLVWFFITYLYLVITNKIVINSFDILVNKIFFNPIDGPLWYCLALLILMIPSPLIIKLKDKKIISTFLLLILLIWSYLRASGMIGHLFTFDNWWWYENMIAYLQSYCIGIYLALNFSDRITNPKRKCKYSNVISIIFILLFGYLSVKLDNFSLKQLSYIVIVIGLWVLIDFKSFTKKNNHSCNISFVLYAIHQPILIPEINKLYGILFANVSGWSFVLLKFLGILVMIMICYLIIFILKKIKKEKLLFYLTGGRI